MRSINNWLWIPALSAACSSPTEAPKETRSVTIFIDQAHASPDRFGLTGDEPVFIGLSVSESPGKGSSYRLQAGENSIEVPAGVPLQFRASLLTLRPESRSILLSSSASTTMTVPASAEAGDGEDGSELTVNLNFAPYRPLRMVNVFGLIHSDAETPASGARISVVDPLSGAPITVPGLEFLSEADERGAYRFAFPVQLPGSRDTIRLRIEHRGATAELTLGIVESGLPGYTLSAINLANDGEVLPAFLNLEDYDGDGAPNTVEIASGTNPFAIDGPTLHPMTDYPCLEPGYVTKGTLYFCPNGSKMTGTLELA
jgi:hypothetical protein